MYTIAYKLDKNCMTSSSKQKRRCIQTVFKWIFFFMLFVIFADLLANYFICQDEIHPQILKAQIQRIGERRLLIYKEKIPQDYKITWLDYALFYQVLSPEVHCRDLFRVGRVQDGGKWICNPFRIRNNDNCVIYSLGLNNEISFEEHIQELAKNKCKIRAFDKGNQTNETMVRLEKINGVFRQAKITPASNAPLMEFSFTDILQEQGDKQIEILKIDIEGNEFFMAAQFVQIPVCQIVMEIHGRLHDQIVHKAQETFDLVKTFAQAGFYFFNFEINSWHHENAEYSFIHESCLEKYGVKHVFGRFLI